MTFVNNARSAKQTSEKETEISGKLEAIIVAGNSIFRIDGNTLKFVSLEFYNGVYAGNKSTAIDFENKITDISSDPLKKGRYIFDWIKEIFKAIEAELPNQKEESQYDEQGEEDI